jgi:hypothetical protein
MLECYPDKEALIKEPQKREREEAFHNLSELAAFSGPSKKLRMEPPTVI